MKTNKNCKKLNLTCQKLKGKCSKKLNVAIGNSRTAKKCKTNLKDNGNEKVDSFCALQCKICNNSVDASIIKGKLVRFVN